jgi:tight adherence protein C
MSGFESASDLSLIAGILGTCGIFLLLTRKIDGNLIKTNFRDRAWLLIKITGLKSGNDVLWTSIQKKIIQADIKLQAEYIIGIQVVSFTICIFLFLYISFQGLIDFYWGVILSVLLYFLPEYWLTKKAKKRMAEIKKDIPDFCMLFANALNGAELLVALDEVAKTMKGELSREINRALSDIATGDSKSLALQKMALRCSIPELTGLVNKIMLSIRYGSSMEMAVKHHGEKILNRRKLEVQKVAGELTIKLLFPIVAFVLLPFFAMLGFPILWNIINVFN